jgi:hypothetical protein
MYVLLHHIPSLNRLTNALIIDRAVMCNVSTKMINLHSKKENQPFADLYAYVTLSILTYCRLNYINLVALITKRHVKNCNNPYR